MHKRFGLAISRDVLKKNNVILAPGAWPRLGRARVGSVWDVFGAFQITSGFGKRARGGCAPESNTPQSNVRFGIRTKLVGGISGTDKCK